ncbi:MAG: hypothetical protein AAGF24_01235 [Cyanobacteria bacterium P01_H01_bin.121]
MSVALIICPGWHNQSLTADFLQAWGCNLTSQTLTIAQCHYELCVIPTALCPPYSPTHTLAFVHHWLEQRCQKANSESEGSISSTIWLAFSAGVVGGLLAARQWQQITGGNVRRFIALDAWGMPLIADFPIYHLSHDWLTHCLMFNLSGAAAHFYAAPAVTHHQLWQGPQQAWGYKTFAGRPPQRLTALQFLQQCLTKV